MSEAAVVVRVEVKNSEEILPCLATLHETLWYC
jgi:hypothetical protein